MVEKYKSGFFTIANLDRTPFKKQVKGGESTIIKETCKSEINDGNYIENFRNIPPIYFATANNDAIVLFKKNNTFKKDSVCEFCHKKIVGDSIGVPVRYLCKTVIQTTNNVQVYKLYNIFWLVGEYCDFNHAYLFLLKGRTLGFSQRDYHYSDSERYLKIFHSIMRPDDPPLCETNDPCILESNGGSVSKSDSEKYRYKKTPGLILYPISEEYMRM